MDRPRLVPPHSNELLKALLAWNLSQTADCVGWLLTCLESFVLAKLQQYYENHRSEPGGVNGGSQDLGNLATKKAHQSFCLEVEREGPSTTK